MTASVKNVEAHWERWKEQGTRLASSFSFWKKKNLEMYFNILKRERDLFINKTAGKNVFPLLSRFSGQANLPTGTIAPAE